jgi:histidinol-phosphate aminotransferase
MFPSRRSFLRSVGASITAECLSALPSSTGHALEIEPERQDQGGVVLLNNNENAYGPSRGVQAQLQKSLLSANRYPVSGEMLVARIAAMHRVQRECVLVGCGSTELLRAVSAEQLRPGKTLITASPTFEAVSRFAHDCGALSLAIPLDHEFSHDLNATLSRVDSSTALIYICNPNNPTGSITPRASIEQFLTKLPSKVIVVVDEAYHHFAPRSPMCSSFLDQPVANKNLIVLRTFSVVHGLAGLRVGYAISSPDLADRLRRRITKMGVCEMGLQAALAALDDDDGLRLSVKRNADARQEFLNQAMARMLKPVDSKTNFVMMDAHHPAVEVIEHFRKNNVLIGGPFPPMDTYVRVSIGTPKDMEAFWRVWDQLPYAHDMKM